MAHRKGETNQYIYANYKQARTGLSFKQIILFKEELHNRFNSISEERVKMFKHNSENLMKIG